VNCRWCNREFLVKEVWEAHEEQHVDCGEPIVIDEPLDATAENRNWLRRASNDV